MIYLVVYLSGVFAFFMLGAHDQEESGAVGYGELMFLSICWPVCSVISFVNLLREKRVKNAKSRHNSN